jgi:hypothetical protein
MVRSKKSEDNRKEGATLSIDVDSFVRTRDSVSCFIFFIPAMSQLQPMTMVKMAA